MWALATSMVKLLNNCISQHSHTRKPKITVLLQWTQKSCPALVFNQNGNKHVNWLIRLNGKWLVLILFYSNWALKALKRVKQSHVCAVAEKKKRKNIYTTERWKVASVTLQQVVSFSLWCLQSCCLYQPVRLQLTSKSVQIHNKFSCFHTCTSGLNFFRRNPA